MPRIKRWFHVSHEINSDEEVWELTDTFGVWGLRMWLQLLSIADRNEGVVKGDLDLLSKSMSRLWGSNSRRFNTVWRANRARMALEWMQNKRWIDIKSDSIIICNWAIYNPTRDSKKSPPNPPNPPIRTKPSKNHRNDSSSEPEKKRSGSKVTPFPEKWIWIQELVSKENGSFPKDRFLDFAWWDAVSYTCGGLSPEFLEREFAAMRRWIMDNPQREPTPRGYRKFVAGWLERAYDKERRFNAQGTKPSGGFIRR